MRELERESGVGRETIRFYIREGLLPEPERATRNSAVYSDDHLTRLRAIRRLQDERFLPLAVIRSLLDEDHGARWLHPEALPDLDSVLRARLDGAGGRLPAAQVAADAGLVEDGLADAAAEGLIELAGDGSVSPRDARIIRLLAEASKLGFDREHGYEPFAMVRYLNVARALAEAEVREFFENIAPHVDVAQAADMAENGIGLMNALLSELHTREILRLLDARRRVANDNGQGGRE